MNLLKKVPLLFLPIAVLTSCLDCADCTGCADPSRDTAMCFRDYKDYYRDKQEWRDDVRAYEDVNDCNCK